MAKPQYDLATGKPIYDPTTGKPLICHVICCETGQIPRTFRVVISLMADGNGVSAPTCDCSPWNTTFDIPFCEINSSDQAVYVMDTDICTFVQTSVCESTDNPKAYLLAFITCIRVAGVVTKLNVQVNLGECRGDFHRPCSGVGSCEHVWTKDVFVGAGPFDCLSIVNEPMTRFSNDECRCDSGAANCTVTLLA